MKKILFVQLPLVDYGYNYILGNMPCAPASIAAFINKYHKTRARVELLPFIISGFGSNGTIAHSIDNKRPDIVCFSVYLWNAERSIRIAENIKRRNPETRIIFGGPEIQTNSWVLEEKRACVDIFVCGEGEWYFDKYFTGEIFDQREVNGNQIVVQPSGELLKSSRIQEPFLSGHLEPLLDGSIFIEMMRGCPYRCSYCYYSKNCNKVREINFSKMVKAIEKGKKLNVNEIYIVSPSFNILKGINEKLDKLESMEHGIKLHTEMRTQNINEQFAHKLYGAGFRSLEVGLQTLTRNALERIGRRSDVWSEIDGMKHLKKAGIELSVGIIPGLPGDTYKEFKKTIKVLIDEGLGENAELYPLLLLPGTRIRDEGARDGVSFMERPPYAMIEGWGFTKDSLCSINNELEQMTGYTHKTKNLPRIILNDEGILINGILIEGDNIEKLAKVKWEKYLQTSVFTIQILHAKGAYIKEHIDAVISSLCLDDMLYNIIFYSDELFDEKIIERVLRKIEYNTLHSRMHSFYEWRDRQSVRFFQVYNDIQSFMQAEESYMVIDPVFSMDHQGARYLKEGILDGSSLIITSGLYSMVSELLIRYYGDAPDLLIFESESDQELFYHQTGREYVKWPFSLRTVRI
jgi:hypothetical protein